MQLIEGETRPGTNDSGYSLFQIAAVLKIDKGVKIDPGRIRCSLESDQRRDRPTSGGLRACIRAPTKPASTASPAGNAGCSNSPRTARTCDLSKSKTCRQLHHEQGVKLEWPEYEVGTEHLQYFLPRQAEERPRLPFYTIWKSPAARRRRSPELTPGR